MSNFKQELSYTTKQEQELYLERELTFADYSVSITAGSVAGNQEKPNEDAFAVSTDSETTIIAGVFDGCTSLKPIVALGDRSGAHFASHFLKDNMVAHVGALKLEEMLLDLNEGLLVESARLGGSLSDTHSLPASTATLVKISGGSDSLDFAHVGDTFGIAYYDDGRSNVFTDDRNAVFDNRMFDLIAKIAAERGLTFREAREDERVKSALVDMFITRNNNPEGLGSGLVNGDPSVAKYVQFGSVALKGVNAILLGSDGLLPVGWSLKEEEDRQKLRTAIDGGGFRNLFAIKHDAEDRDPDWNYARYKHSDDATGLFVEL